MDEILIARPVEIPISARDSIRAFHFAHSWDFEPLTSFCSWMTRWWSWCWPGVKILDEACSLYLVMHVHANALARTRCILWNWKVPCGNPAFSRLRSNQTGTKISENLFLIKMPVSMLVSTFQPLSLHPYFLRPFLTAWRRVPVPVSSKGQNIMFTSDENLLDLTGQDYPGRSYSFTPNNPLDCSHYGEVAFPLNFSSEYWRIMISTLLVLFS